MNYKILIIAILGFSCTLAAAIFIDFSAAGIILVIVLTILMGSVISADAARHRHPELFVSLSEDARTVRVENLGTAPAISVELTIIPGKDLHPLGDIQADEIRSIELPAMMEEGKAAISWIKKDGSRNQKIFRLSGYLEETDPLKPAFPLFGWNNK